jgi:hypothetical protein
LSEVFPIRLKSEVVFENTGQQLQVTIES